MRVHKIRKIRSRRIFLSMFAVALFLSTQGFAQKPSAFEPNADAPNASSTDYQRLITLYLTNEPSDNDLARQYRNNLIFEVKKQVDVYYEDTKKGKKRDKKWFQMIFDVLEVATTAAIGITTGTLRAKTVMAQGLSGLQAGRDKFYKNFNILETQAVINQMRADRANIWLRIKSRVAERASDYPWAEAKVDLFEYFAAGIFENGLDNLVAKTGSNADAAELKVAVLKIKPSLLATPAMAVVADQAFQTLNRLAAEVNGLAAGSTNHKIAMGKLLTIAKELRKDADLVTKIGLNPTLATDFANINGETSNPTNLIGHIQSLRANWRIVNGADLDTQQRIDDIIIRHGN